MKDVKKAFEMMFESLKVPTHKTIKELIRRLEALEKAVSKSIAPAKAPQKGKAPAKEKTTKVTPAKKAAPVKKTTAKKAKKVTPKPGAGKEAITKQILNIIQKSPKGLTVGELRKTTGLESKQISNIVFRLAKQGKVVKKDRGVYAIK